MKKDLTPKEVAKLCGLTHQLIMLYCRKGLLPGAYKFRGTRWRIPIKSAELLFNGELDVSSKKEI